MRGRVKLLIEPPADGAWNMAVDEVLLDAAAAGDATLRFYRWQEATLSLGYFQAAGARREHAASGGCPMVRRLTGGGAIVHDRELTYSIALPAGAPWITERDALYRLMHASLLEALQAWRLEAALCGEPATHSGDGRARGEEPFLCFERRAAGDVVLGASKIGGSAQRRRRGAVLQHGSVLLAASGAAPELPGIRELRGVVIDPAELTVAWCETMARRAGMEFAPAPLQDTERAAATRLAAACYRNDRWTLERVAPRAEPSLAGEDASRTNR